MKSATYIEWKIIFKELRMLTELYAWWLIRDRKDKVGGSLSHNVIEAASGGPSGTLKSWKIKLDANDNYALAA